MTSSIRTAKKFALCQESLMIVRLDIAERDGHFFITSPNLPGLNASGFGVEAAYQATVRMAKALYRHNSGFEVEVWPATTETSQFPKMMHLCSELVVQRKAAKPLRTPLRRPEDRHFRGALATGGE